MSGSPLRYLLVRLAWALVVTIGATAVAFAVAFVVPADPARALAGPKADRETLESIRKELGLDRPLAQQYWRFLGRLARGDLGRSYVSRRPVAQAIGERLPATALLAAASLSVALVIGLLGGVATAARAGGAFDRLGLVGAITVLSAPTFWLGMLFLYYAGFKWRLVPLGGSVSLAGLIGPSLVLGGTTGAYYSRLLHVNLAEVLGAPYIRAARAKGAGGWVVLWRHALRNAALPLVTVVGLDFAGLLNGVVLAETVFHWPGLGRLAFESVLAMDLPMIMGTVVVAAIMVVFANIVIDLVYVLIDPRVGLQ